jgi:hypothetical protein
MQQSGYPPPPPGSYYTPPPPVAYYPSPGPYHTAHAAPSQYQPSGAPSPHVVYVMQQPSAASFAPQQARAPQGESMRLLAMESAVEAGVDAALEHDEDDAWYCCLCQCCCATAVGTAIAKATS